MTLQPADLDRLEQLASAAQVRHRATVGINPATVSELVAAARLGAAWEEAKAALPEGLLLRLVQRVGGYDAEAMTPLFAGGRFVRSEFATPAAALLALVEVLRERASG